MARPLKHVEEFASPVNMASVAQRMPRVLGLAMLVDTASWEVQTLRARDPVLLVTTVQPDRLRRRSHGVLLANTA